MAARRKTEPTPVTHDDDFDPTDIPTPITDKQTVQVTPPVPSQDFSGLTIQEKLLVPFPESDISVGDDGFDYVDPEKYRARLHEIFPSGYTFEALVDKIIDLNEENLFGLEGKGYFHVYVDEGHGGPFQATITRTVFEEFIIGASKPTATWKGNLGEVLKAPQTYSMFASAALKAVATELGIGQHLYHKEAKKSEQGLAKRGRKATDAPKTAQVASNPSASTSTSSAPSSASTGSVAPSTSTWDGSQLVPFGKPRKEGQTYAQVAESWLLWAANLNPDLPKLDQAGKPNPDRGAVQELARRRSESTAKATASAAASVGSDNLIPF